MRAPMAPTRALARLLGLTAIVVTLLLSSTPTSSAAPAPDAPAPNVPILFVHGYEPSPNPGGDVTAFPRLLSEMATDSSRTVVPISYYVRDVNGPSVQSSGTAKAGFSSGKQKGGNTTHTDIRHLSYQLAWWIYDNYSSKGQPVDVIGHSMGGLIIRWMVYGLQADRSWPPVLLIEDAVTVSTPHLGLSPLKTTGLACVGSLQCDQMRSSSSFIKELRAKGRGPRATGGTDWTAIAAQTGDLESAAVLTDMGADHVTLVTKSDHAAYFRVPSSVQLILDAVSSPDR